MAEFDAVPTSGSVELKAAVTRAVDVLGEGGLVAHPTSTVYGLGGAARPDVDRMASRLKGRDSRRHPILRIASDASVLREAFPDLEWTEAAHRLADRFWPGPLTLILSEVSGATTAVRVEAHPVTRAVLTEWGRPIGSTSLNQAGTPPATTVPQARQCLADMPVAEAPTLLLEAADLPGGPASTMVSVTAEAVTVVRGGALSEEDVRRCLR